MCMYVYIYVYIYIYIVYMYMYIYTCIYTVGSQLSELQLSNIPANRTPFETIPTTMEAGWNKKGATIIKLTT